MISSGTLDIGVDGEMMGEREIGRCSLQGPHGMRQVDARHVHSITVFVFQRSRSIQRVYHILNVSVARIYQKSITI